MSLCIAISKIWVFLIDFKLAYRPTKEANFNGICN